MRRIYLFFEDCAKHVVGFWDTSPPMRWFLKEHVYSFFEGCAEHVSYAQLRKVLKKDQEDLKRAYFIKIFDFKRSPLVSLVLRRRYNKLRKQASLCPLKDQEDKGHKKHKIRAKTNARIPSLLLLNS